MVEMDSISFRVLWGRLVGVVEEAGATLRHSAFSSIVSEGNDCTAVLFDARGHELAEPVSFTATSFIGTIPRTMKILLGKIPPEKWRPGDILACNDPWICTGHLFDICLAVPIFLNGRLVAFSVTCSHTANIGGGGRIDAQSVFEEGLQIPICWLHRDGIPQTVVFDFIRANVPFPTQVLGDIGAQINANLTTIRRVVEIMTELGISDLRPVADMIALTCQNAMRQSVLRLPKGYFEYDLSIDGIDQDLTIRCAVSIPGDGSLAFDFAGTSPQVKSAINSPIHYTLARTFYALKALLLPHTPGNEATFANVTVSVPTGSILNPQFPYPNAYRSVMGHFVPSAVMGTLSLAAPDQVLAEGAGPIWSLTASGERQLGERFSAHIVFGCGQGAWSMRNGMDAVTYPGNPANTPVEVIERETPFRFESKELLRESGGIGQRRGGWGQKVALRAVGSVPITVGVHSARTSTPALGLAGGGPGATGKITLNGIKADIRHQFTMVPGDLLVLETPGGGGWGDPAIATDGEPDK